MSKNQEVLDKKKVLPWPWWKKIIVFLVFEFVFTAITMPVLIFYGPFQNIKKTIVGMSWNTLKHQYIAKFFLSDEAIARILGNGYSTNLVDSEEEVQTLNFGVNHTDRIELYNIDGGSFDGKMMIIYDPTRVAVGYSSQIPKAGEVTSVIAKRNGAVAAINAGGFLDQQWSGTGGSPLGFIIHDGKYVSGEPDNKNVKQETAAFTDTGMLIVGRHSAKQLQRYNIKEGVSFGPPLIVNSKPTITQGDGGWGIAPRTAIGQRKDGAVLLLTVDGRSLSSFGATLRDVQDILLKYDAVNAVNLDGGSSTTMYFNNKVINKPSDALGERAVSSVFMVIPEEGGVGK